MSLPCHQVERMRPVIIRDNAWAPVIKATPMRHEPASCEVPRRKSRAWKSWPVQGDHMVQLHFYAVDLVHGRPLRRLLSSPCCCSGLSGRPSAVRLCSPCGSWCHGNTRTAPSAQSSSGWSPTHGESAGIRPSDVSRTTSRGHRAAKGERTSWGAATSSLCVYRGSGCVGPRVASVGPRGTHSGCDEIGPGGNLVGRPPPIARFSM